MERIDIGRGVSNICSHVTALPTITCVPQQNHRSFESSVQFNP